MEMLSLLLMFASIILFIVGVVLLIIKAIKHKKKASALIMIVAALILFVVGVMIMPTGETPSTNGTGVVSEETYSDTEVFAAEFCMAYMNSLKNPYSFSVKSIWAMDNGDGSYQVYVKFTAQNSLGADVADEVGTMGSLTKEHLKELASGGEYVGIHTWGSEPSGKITGDGETLDAAKIQTYINEHYE